MANLKVNYAKKIEKLLSEMPSFISDYIYNFGNNGNIATKLEYCRDIKDFLRFMVNYIPEYSNKQIKDITLDNLDNIEPLDINRYITIISGDTDNGLKDATVKRRRATLSSMYGFFVINRKLKNNPVLATRTIKIPEKELIYLTNEEQNLLLETIKTGNNLTENQKDYHNKYIDRDIALIYLILDTGLRISEVLNSDVADYNLDDCYVVVTRKGGAIKSVYFSDQCAIYLNNYFQSQIIRLHLEKDEIYTIPAFTTIKGERLGVRAVEKLVKKYVLACLPNKVKVISPHKLRSSFAMSFYKASNNDLLLLKEKLNHTNIATTNIYAKASNEDIKNSRNLLQNIK